MSLLLPAASVVAGLVLVVLGAEALVRGAASIAKKLSISEIAIGLTVVALGTSAPELVINTFAAADGRHTLVFGNIIGSNMANILLVLGVAALIRPLVVQKNTVWKEIPFLLLATLVVFLLAYDSWGSDGTESWLSRNDGLVLLGFFAIFLMYTFGLSKVESTDQRNVTTYPHWISLMMIGGGLVALLFGGSFTVSGATSIAQQMGVSEKLIACTIIAIGTSLPELATSAVAAYRGRSDIAIGNIVGSGIFNLLMVLGLSSVIRPIRYDPSVFNVDVIVLIAVTMLLFLTMFTGKKRRLDRWEASLMLLGFAGYMGYLLYKQ